MPISDCFQSASSRARLLAIAPLTCLLITQPLAAQGRTRLAEAELQRRAGKAQEAQELLKKGDESYKAGKWSEAVDAYAGARSLLPDAPATADARAAATERLAQASVELARKQRRMGDNEGAAATLDKILAPDVAPADAAARQLREELDDPIRTNPAANREHAENVDKVRRQLYEAEGFKNLGKYDAAEAMYQEVLRVDPTNKAARRGMEDAVQLRADYYRAAYDETRARHLAEVDAGWELKPRPLIEATNALGPVDEGAAPTRMLISAKLDRLIIPRVDFEGTTIQEALDYLRGQSITLDTFELDTKDKGVNFVLDLGPADSPAAKEILSTKINLQLKNVPISQVLKYIGEQTKTTYASQEYAVAIRPVGGASAELITRSYRVPPDFLSSGGSVGAGEGASDPFAGDKPAEGLLAKRMNALTRLKEMGIPFPEGANADFIASTSTLRVVNTVENQEMVQQVVAAAQSAKPTMVAVTVRVIKTQQRTLEELDFDWLLDDFSLGGKSFAPGISATHLSGGSPNPDNLSDVALPDGAVFRNGLTSGNRSGNEAIVGNSIDDRILMAQQGFAPGSARAPGVLWANGFLNNANLTMLMRGFQQKKGVDLMVSPTTVTRSGQQSTLASTKQFIYPTEYEPPELPNTVGSTDFIDPVTGLITNGGTGVTPITPATPTSFETREVGVVLDVLPTVSEDGQYVDVTLKPTVTDFDGFVNYGTPITSPAPSVIGAIGGAFGDSQVVLTPNEILMPVFSVMKAETALTIRNGATLVIGGLMDERVQKVQDKTQFFGDLPLVGRMFRNEAYAPVRTAIVFLVTVQVLDPTGQPPSGH
ncbi:Amuc_1098 family type IV pilus outer membrane protein [Haloferula sp. BvORR071]|uniref:Amuc_1098 family type IV pilus outer membrane protein n=1 Tax=Haloferula sp. BvORR071 TaxID=1396141 RepID=UPI000557A143|nr:Amuc_1098 family type IV pilus outer membrane protein [Haloferula sp. BvORR071]